MKAILLILSITDTSHFPTEHKLSYDLVEMHPNITWEECADSAYGINSDAPIEVGKVTAVCFPYTVQDGIDYGNERSRQHS